jgi:hypothetical protein
MRFTKFNDFKAFSLLTFLLLVVCPSMYAQDTTHVDTTATAATPSVPDKPKEIKKLEDANLPGEMVYRISKMKPKEILDLDETFQYNERGEDGENIVTVKLRFRGDNIIGIIKRAPLYESINSTTSTTYINIPVQWCCTTPIDSVHTKQHCGKMHELRDFEEKEHCKDWIQKDEAKQEAEEVQKFGKPDPKNTKGKKEKEKPFVKPAATKPAPKPKDIKKKGKPTSIPDAPETPAVSDSTKQAG